MISEGEKNKLIMRVFKVRTSYLQFKYQKQVIMLNSLGKLDVVKFTTLQQEKLILVGKLEL